MKSNNKMINEKRKNEKGKMRNCFFSGASSLLSPFCFLLLKGFLLSAFSFLLFVSCEQTEDFVPQETTALQFVVSDFPAFDEGTATRAFGTPDAGKTAWAGGDMILVHFNSPKYGDQAVTLTFENGDWKSDGGTLKYVENESPTITAVYAPDCEIKPDNTIGLKVDRQYGMAEYILANASIRGNILELSFDKGRKYSRLRIVTDRPTLQVDVNDFIPAGLSEVVQGKMFYQLTPDDKGNAYLYGIFKYNTQVKVVSIKEYHFQKDSEAGKSYVFDVRPLDVDLGLPSRTLWATRNVGADNPWDYGDYFAWGDTSPKPSYTWDNYSWGAQDNLTKYNSTDGITTLEAGDDAATENMGADWSTPTKEQWEELIEQCTWTKTTLNGVNGYTITGYYGNSIFLPAAGHAESYKGGQGQYWTTDIGSDTKQNAAYFNFFYIQDRKELNLQGCERYQGLSVRGVKK